MFRKILNFYGEELLAFRQNPPSWRPTLCRLSATAYSIYSQLPFIFGGLSFIRNLTTRHTAVTGTHLSLCVSYSFEINRRTTKSREQILEKQVLF
jgi:hypothetical protein